MIVKKLLRDEKGASLPFVTIILGLFALGFIALVVDVGFLYVERKAMITSADAAALAGAQVLRVSQGVNVNGVDGAIATAKKYAIANGADESHLNINPPYVGTKLVTLPDGTTETRQVVEVTVKKNKQLLFARFLGDEDTDVKANAIATWGYIRKTYIGSFIPLFTFDTDYKLNTDIFLHENIDDTNGYGFIDIGAGMGDVKKAIAGTDVGGSYIYDNYLDGKPGAGESLRGAVEDRMIIAQGKATAVERRNTMIGLVPIIDKAEFLSLPENDSGNANNWKLPIKYFAYFEIIDVIKQNTTDGSTEALNPANEYTKKGTPPFPYSGSIPANLLKGNGKADNTIVLGRFTGEIVEARTIAEAGDQIKPNPGGDSPATYSKLIK